jgi:hypothetical protein
MRGGRLGGAATRPRETRLDVGCAWECMRGGHCGTLVRRGGVRNTHLVGQCVGAQHDDPCMPHAGDTDANPQATESSNIRDLSSCVPSKWGPVRVGPLGAPVPAGPGHLRHSRQASAPPVHLQPRRQQGIRRVHNWGRWEAPGTLPEVTPSAWNAHRPALPLRCSGHRATCGGWTQT